MKKISKQNNGNANFLETSPIQYARTFIPRPSTSSSPPSAHTNSGEIEAKRGRHKLKIITYKYGGGGAQDGAQDGPDNLRLMPDQKSSQSPTNLANATLESALADYELTFHNPIPDHITHQNSHPDASFVTRVSAKSGQIKQEARTDGSIVRRMVKIDPDNTSIKKYHVTTHPDGRVDVPMQPYATKLVENIKSRPPGLDQTGKKLYYPNGIKNLPYVESAVENTAAAVCHEILSSQWANATEQIHMPPLVLGGDHTQGLATNIGARLAAVTMALLSENTNESIPLCLPTGQDRKQVLSGVRQAAETLHMQTSQSSILQATRALGKAIEKLIDKNFFQQVRNEQLYRDVKSELNNQENSISPFDIKVAISHRRKSLLQSKDDQGILRIDELKKYMSTIHEFWFDAHGDWNTEVTSPSKNSHGMPLAFASGHGVMANVLGTAFLEIDPENTHTFGTRDTDAAEKKLMLQVGVNINRAKEIQDAGKRLHDASKSPEELFAHRSEWGLTQLFNEQCAAISQKVLTETGREAQFIVSYDGDGIHATGDAANEGVASSEGNINAKGFSATGTPVSKGGPKSGYALKAVEGLHTKYKILAYDFSEYNPHLGIAQNANLSAQDKQALLKKNTPHDGSVETTREISLAFIKSIYAKKRTPVPGSPTTT